MTVADGRTIPDAVTVEDLPGVALAEASQPVMRAFTRHLERVSPEATYIALRKLEGLEAAIFDIDTGAPQRPVFPVLARERLLVIFCDDGRPVVGPLRDDFPINPPFGFRRRRPATACPSRILCLDDRPWEDAKGDYNAAGLLRRILAWFARAASGQMDDPLQVPEPAFRPAPISIVMPSNGTEQLTSSETIAPRYWRSWAKPRTGCSAPSGSTG